MPRSRRPATFRATIQQLGLNKLRNSPMKRVQQAAFERVTNSGGVTSAVASAKDIILSRQISRSGLTDRLRMKLQEAMQQATDKATRMLTTAAASASTTSSSFLSGHGPADMEKYYHKMQQAFREGKRTYYSCVPFDERWDGIQRSLAVLGRVSTGNKVVPYRDSGDAFEHMWESVDNAQDSVLWQTYICKDDLVGQTTIKKMVAARQLRNCHTELLYDCGGNITGRSRLTGDLKQCGATVIQYRPFFRSFLRYMFRGLDWRISPGLRNHRKILIVDGKIGFCGGLNIGNEYCGVKMGGNGKFRDTHCAVIGPAVADLQKVYDDTKQPQPWKFSWARWRQIATAQLNRRYAVGRNTMEAGFLRSIQERTRISAESGGIYFRKQPCPPRVEAAAPTRMEHQEEKKKKKKGETANGDAEAKHEEDPSACSTSANHNNASCYDTSKSDNCEDSACKNPDGTPNKCVFRTNVLQRKVVRERVRALYNAQELPHKRSYTRLLLQVPLADTEPVPEAEMYCNNRPHTTQILSCNPRYRDYSIQYAFWQVTRKCHRRIWITTPYYLPTRKLFRALLHAASRGVDVRILAGSSTTTDPWWMWHASKYITERLLRGGIRIYEYKGTQIMHGKTVVVDSVWSSIGSYNWDVMSNKNLEVCLCQLDTDIAREMENHFLMDLSMSEEVKLEGHQQRSLWLRFTSWMFYNFVYILDRVTFRSFADEDVDDSPGIPH